MTFATYENSSYACVLFSTKQFGVLQKLYGLSFRLKVAYNVRGILLNTTQ